MYPYQFAPDGSVIRQDWDTGTLNRIRPPFVVLSEYDYDDALRRRDPAAKTYLQALMQDYHRAVSVGGGEGRYGLPTHNLPSDMLYTNPVITIYTRN